MQETDPEIDRDQKGDPQMTINTIKHFCNEMVSNDPGVVDKLYLFDKKFKKIGQLHVFTNLVSLWLNNNQIQKIQNLEGCKNLVCLYLNQNKISKIEGLEKLTRLEILNLQKNSILNLQGLQSLNSLKNLNISTNFLSTPQSIIELKSLKNLSILDISSNQLQSSEQMFSLLIQFKNLSCLTLKLTPFARGFKNYRKRVIAALKDIKFFDDRPVQDIDHRLCEAWVEGGVDEEKKQRIKIKNDVSKVVSVKKEQKTQIYNQIDQKNQSENKAILKTVPKKQLITNKVQPKQELQPTKAQHEMPQMKQINFESDQQLQELEDLEEEERPTQQDPLLKKWKTQYNPLLELLLQKHKFDFWEVQPQFNMIVVEINKKLGREHSRFEVEELQKVWTVEEIKRRNCIKN